MVPITQRRVSFERSVKLFCCGKSLDDWPCLLWALPSRPRETGVVGSISSDLSAHLVEPYRLTLQAFPGDDSAFGLYQSLPREGKQDFKAPSCNLFIANRYTSATSSGMSVCPTGIFSACVFAKPSRASFGIVCITRKHSVSPHSVRRPRKRERGDARPTSRSSRALA